MLFMKEQLTFLKYVRSGPSKNVSFCFVLWQVDGLFKKENKENAGRGMWGKNKTKQKNIKNTKDTKAYLKGQKTEQ